MSHRRGLMLTAGNRIAGEAKTEFDLLTRICQAAADVGGYAFAWERRRRTRRTVQSSPSQGTTGATWTPCT